MSKRPLSALCVLSLLLISSGALGGANPNGSTWLSWNQDYSNPLIDLSVMPTGNQDLYLQVGNINEIAGFDVMVLWYPPGPALTGCYEALEDSVPVGAGGSCTWVMRGTVSCGINDPFGEDFWNPTCSTDECNIVCMSGNVAYASFTFASCGGDIPGTFCISYMKITDCEGLVDFLNIVGDATVLGGDPTEQHPCLVATERTTWGATKALYR